jgi:hypothetical protein
MIMEEIWKDIDGLAGYSVSNTGKVKFNERLRKLVLNHKGYPCAQLRKKKVYIHRAVACAFIPNPNNLPTVNHIDGDKQNNHVSNLEWASYSYNLQHSYDIGIRKAPKAMLGKFGYQSHTGKEVIAYNLEGQQIGVYGSTALCRTSAASRRVIYLESLPWGKKKRRQLHVRIH